MLRFILFLFIVSCFFTLKLPATEPHSSTIFYQPQHSDFTSPKWEEKFKKLHQLGFKEIIIQWSRYGNYSFLDKYPNWLADFLDLAEKYEIYLVFGLYSDPKYFQEISRKDSLEIYLKILSIQHLSLATELTILTRGSNAFIGWYIPDELDDLNWQESSKQKILKDYLQTLEYKLAQLSPNKSVLISSFFSSKMKIKAYVDMISYTIPKSWIVLFQSGVGAKLVSLEESKSYFNYFSKYYKKVYIPIIELFTIEDKNLKVSYLSFEEQKKYLNIEKSILFSWRYFFTKEFQHYYNNNK